MCRLHFEAPRSAEKATGGQKRVAVSYVTVARLLQKKEKQTTSNFLTNSNMTSTVLVTGASGFLGRAVFNTFQHSGVLVVGQGFSRAAPPTILKADLEKQEDIKRLFDEVK